MPTLASRTAPTAEENQSYNLQPAAWQSADITSTQFQMPSFSVGWPGSAQGNAALAWSSDPYDNLDGLSYAAKVSGLSDNALPFAPLYELLDSQPQEYGCQPTAGNPVLLQTSSDGGLAGTYDVSPMASMGDFSGGVPMESTDVGPTGGN